MITARLNSKGQITIPMSIRKQLKLGKGDEVSFHLDGRNIIVFPKYNQVESAFGLLKADVSASAEDMKKAIEQGACGDSR